MRCIVMAVDNKGDYHDYEFSDLDKAIERLDFMLCHNTKWRSIGITVGESGLTMDYFSPIYKDPQWARKEIEKAIEKATEKEEEE